MTVLGAHQLSEIKHRVSGATITVGDEEADVVNVAVQLLDGNGAALAHSAVVTVFLSDDDGGAGIAASAPDDGGTDIGTDGAILFEHTADIVLVIQSEADGSFDLDVQETGANEFFLVVVLPSGEQVVSGAITFAS